MLKRRLIPKILLKTDGRRMISVTTVHFAEQKEVGDPVSQAKIYQAQMADELLFLDMDRTLRRDRELLAGTIRKAAQVIFMPFTVGGGVTQVDDFRLLLLNGADKVAINTAALERPELITEAAETYGSQCVVVSMDCRLAENGTYTVWKNSGQIDSGWDAALYAKESEARGAGEILLTSIDRDGTGEGLDLALIRLVTAAVKIPVIAAGGCGLAKHFVEGFREGGADAVSAGTFFAFRDQNLMQTRSHIKSGGVSIRLQL